MVQLGVTLQPLRSASKVPLGMGTISKTNRGVAVGVASGALVAVAGPVLASVVASASSLVAVARTRGGSVGLAGMTCSVAMVWPPGSMATSERAQASMARARLSTASSKRRGAGVGMLDLTL